MRSHLQAHRSIKGMNALQNILDLAYVMQYWSSCQTHNNVLVSNMIENYSATRITIIHFHVYHLINRCHQQSLHSQAVLLHRTVLRYKLDHYHAQVVCFNCGP